MRTLPLPGVFRPHSDSRMLATVVARRTGPADSVLDLCTGSGIVAISAAGAGARTVTAVDLSRRAVLAARANARLNGTAIRSVRGDLFEPVAGERFDLIASNPPYVPGVDPSRARGVARAWEGGSDGRALIDRICSGAARHLRPGGRLLLAHSSVNDVDRTLAALERTGLDAEVATEAEGPYGSLLSARAPDLERAGLIDRGERRERVVVVEAAR